MPISPLPSISEDKESDSITKDKLRVCANQDIIRTLGNKQVLVNHSETQHSKVIEDNIGLEKHVFKLNAQNDRPGLNKSATVIPEKKSSTTVKELNGMEENVGKPAIYNSQTVKSSVSLKENVSRPTLLNDRSRLEKPVVLGKSERPVKNQNHVPNEHDTGSSETVNNVLKCKHLSFSKKTPKQSHLSWIQRFSKKEQESLLPRKSHFNCHDKALKEAGYTTDEHERKKVERMERRKIGATLLEDRSNRDNSESKPSTNGETSLPEILVFYPDELNDDGVKAKPIRGRKKHDDSQKIEHKALTEYLKYVKENTTEYFEYLKSKEKLPENMPDNHLIKTAMLFQKGHHGLPYETATVRASHTLNTRSADPGLWQQLNRDNVINLKRLVRKDSIISKLITDKEKEIKVDSEEPKTEYEKVLFKAERWLKTVSTAQLMKARQQALKEVDEEDVDVTQWWIALQKCNYIRRVNTS